MYLNKYTASTDNFWCSTHLSSGVTSSFHLLVAANKCETLKALRPVAKLRLHCAPLCKITITRPARGNGVFILQQYAVCFFFSWEQLGGFKKNCHRSHSESDEGSKLAEKQFLWTGHFIPPAACCYSFRRRRRTRTRRSLFTHLENVAPAVQSLACCSLILCPNITCWVIAMHGREKSNQLSQPLLMNRVIWIRKGNRDCSVCVNITS